MYCQTCAELLAAYRHSVNVYSIVLRKSLGAVGHDEEVERLNLQCRETNDALMAHWRQEHRNSASFPKYPHKTSHVAHKSLSCLRVFAHNLNIR